MVAGFASRGLSVVGVDVDESAVNKLNIGITCNDWFANLINENADRIRSTLSTEEWC